MAARVHRPLKATAFNANDIWGQRYEFSKQLQDLHIDVTVLSETRLTPHERFFIPNYHFYQTDPFPGRKSTSHDHVRPMPYVRHVHLTKAKPIHKRQTHPLVREDVT
jgi:hypothetical protein